ncbi:amidase signature domain-containing protein [Pseudomassariella vexata]|uniref:Amidase signature domain-containing protein n=1 Tax=Pseudomassariella vexata TaxID=1141098 RepID=A0A1Y2DS31_9PEZI|nr:amidase signature domain-containing protein [Pseudomassariella vexata]ORY61485.1 amidase signature domain-containing protein [Pseudomassariella vexata]
MEWLGFLRRKVWADAGFGSLRDIRQHIEDTEPRFDPTVFPLEDAGLEASEGREDAGVREGSEVPTRVLLPWKKYSVADYRSLYLSGELTPLDVVHSILPLIRRDTSPPGEHSMAWFHVNVDLVIRAAEASTLRYKEGRSLGLLDGILTAVKDEYDMEGYITTLGSVNDYTGKIFNEDGKIDAWCVRKLADAGAIIMGKLSMHEFGMDTSSNNMTYGTPLNPYNQNHYTGGSSSGSAYAVAVGLVPITLGSDGGGSIRIPSSFCSVFGLKTTHGRLSSHPGQNHSNTCGVNGPIAADMRSLAALYEVISRPHPTSHFPLTSQVTKYDPYRPKVIGIPEAWFQRATSAIQELCRGMIDWLVARKGYSVVPITMPFVEEGQMAHALTILTDAATLLPDTRGLSPANRILLALGRTTPATDYLLAQKLRRVLMQHLAWLWQTYPGMVIVTPTSGCAGWRIRSEAELKYGVNDGDKTKKTMEYVWLANFCGVPSLSVPVGYIIPEGHEDEGEVADSDTVGKIPVGLMATGEWASELALMQFGLDSEEAGLDRQCRPPNWVDVAELARQRRGESIL